VTDVLSVGDVVWVAPKNPAQPTGVWTLMQVPEVGGGLVAMDPHTGRVHAVVGGFSFATSQFDRALQAKRQPGSSFKPLVYAAALDNGYKPTSIVLDAPIEIDQGPWQGNLAAQELRRHQVVRARPRCGSASRSRATR
jgi:penicillin-binding protein 1A